MKQGCVLNTVLLNLFVNDFTLWFGRNHDPVTIDKYMANVLMH